MQLRHIKSSNNHSSGFVIPADYFEVFNERMLLNLKTAQPKHYFLGDFQTTFYKLAALLVLAFSVPALNYFSPPQISFDDVQNYLAASNIDNLEIATFFNDEDFQYLNSELNVDSDAIENQLISSDDIETYITF